MDALFSHTESYFSYPTYTHFIICVHYLNRCKHFTSFKKFEIVMINFFRGLFSLNIFNLCLLLARVNLTRNKGNMSKSAIA